MTEAEYKQIKAFVLEDLKTKYSSATVSLWFEPMKVVGLDNKKITVSMPQNRKDFVEVQYYDVLKSAFANVVGFDCDLLIISDEEEAFELSGEKEEKQESAYKMRFNPEYTFENFVVGKTNQLAQQAALAVANHPAELNNPLFLYGPSGLGKTHLMFAIMNEVRKKTKPDGRKYNILYVTGEEFMNELVNALAQKTTFEFREKYRNNVDVLLVDDVQFFAGKLTVQEEFFNTFNALYSNKKQIILSSDCAPKDIDNLEERLRGRFTMGLVTDIQPPDLELRVAIFKRKAMDYDCDLELEILYYLAKNITTNVRQIEGALKKLKAHTLMTGQVCTYDVAKEVLSEFFTSMKSDESVISRVLDYSTKRFGVTVEDMKSSKRNADIVLARHTAIYLIRKTTNLAQTSIAKIFNKRDHTTVINSISFIDKKMLKEPAFERELKQVITDLKP